ncbi:MAG TPA: hypothetical protein PKH09_13350 [Parvularculaceae bacterium]|nr:hypothetical protein [Parvularculaceae bacterium]
MTTDKLKSMMSTLLLATGALHLVVAAFGAPAGLAVPLAAFGVLYGALGAWLRKAGKIAVLSAIAATLTGIVLGGANYLQNGGPITLPLMFLIDVAIIAAGGVWLAKSGKSA